MILICYIIVDIKYNKKIYNYVKFTRKKFLNSKFIINYKISLTIII